MAQVSFDDIDMINNLREEGAACRDSIARLEIRRDRVVALYERVRADIESGSMTTGEGAALAKEALAQKDESVPATVVLVDSPPRPRKQRSDAGKPRTPRTSPLNDHCRGILNEQFASGPTTLVAIEAATGWIAKETEALLCEDPESYASWSLKRPGDSAPVVVWGTMDQLVETVGKVSVKGNRIADTVAVLGCSHRAAVLAWQRLDPKRAESNGASPS